MGSATPSSHVGMLFRRLTADPSSAYERSSDAEPAFAAFRKTQQSLPVPFGLLYQSEHSRLAGALARALSPDVFGDLTQDVIAAVADHDCGWDPSDRKQFESIAEGSAPVSFTAMSPEQTLPSWVGSIAHGKQLGPLAEILISRHCCLLGTGAEEHEEFVERETKRRVQIESAALYSQAEYDRWTAALGFCDLLSLYLCSGSRAAVQLPLAHPERRLNDRTVVLDWSAPDRPILSEPIFSSDVVLRANGVVYEGPHKPLEPQSWEWFL